jgi:hypothetical protein
VAINRSMASAENGNIRIAAGGCILVAGSDCGTSIPRAVVATVTLTAAGVFAVSGVLAGALQVAAVGAPVQAKVTVAFWLALICSMYVAVWPAATVAEVEPPEAAARLRVRAGGGAGVAVPVRLIVCETPVALSTTVTIAVLMPAAAGL